jgi:hypothetical protein
MSRGAPPPHEVTASSHAPINAVVASPLTTSPETLAARDGLRTPSAGPPSTLLAGRKHGSLPGRQVETNRTTVTSSQVSPG